MPDKTRRSYTDVGSRWLFTRRCITDSTWQTLVYISTWRCSALLLTGIPSTLRNAWHLYTATRKARGFYLRNRVSRARFTVETYARDCRTRREKNSRFSDSNLSLQFSVFELNSLLEVLSSSSPFFVTLASFFGVEHNTPIWIPTEYFS